MENNNRKTQLQQLLSQLNNIESSLPIDESKSYLDSLLESETRKFQEGLKTNPTVTYLDEFNKKLEQFKKDFDLEPVIYEIEAIQKDIADFKESSSQDGQIKDEGYNQKFSELQNLVGSTKNELSTMTAQQFKDVLTKIDSLQNDLTIQGTNTKQDGQTIKDVVAELSKKITSITKTLSKHALTDEGIQTSLQESLKTNGQAITQATNSVAELRKEMLRRFGQIGGGSMNRQMFINGVDPLTKWTDMNIKPGSNVTITYANNNTTRQVDVTISSSGGGGGSVIGTTRSINTVSTSQTMSNSSNTDYVYIASAGIALTLPSPTANTNLYTVKNTSTSSVVVLPSAAETIDGSSNLILPIRYTSVDLISDTTNWEIT